MKIFGLLLYFVLMALLFIQVYKETGPWTAVVLALVLIDVDLSARNRRKQRWGWFYEKRKGGGQ